MRAAAACGLAAALAVMPAPAASLPEPPSGWRLELVTAAPALRHPSVVCCAPDGRVFVAEDPMDISTAHADAPEGRILCFRPDGSHTVFAERLHAVFGMQYLEGKLYVLHNPQFTVFRDADGVGAERVDLIPSMNPNPWALDWNDHVPANFKLAMDGYFYVATGDKGVFGAVGRDGQRLDMHSGGVFRLRPAGTGLEIHSTGARNVLDVALNDEDDIFTYDNTDEHDWMGRLTHMVEGGFYGYPHDFIPRRPYTLWMMHDFGGGAACDTLCYTEDALPAEYHQNLFLADFGKRQVLRVRLEPTADTFRVAAWDEFFPNPPDDFRPVGIAWGADGLSLYICDWQHADTKEQVVVGRLWKATWTGRDASTPKPAWYLPSAMGQPCKASTPELIDALVHPSKNVRLLAQRRLAERKATEPLVALLRNAAAPARARWHALWALDAIDGGRAARKTILRATTDPDDSVRRQTIRQLGLRRAYEAAARLSAALSDSNAAVRFQAATSLGRIGERRAIPALQSSLKETNLFTRFAAFTALSRIGRANPASWSSIVGGLADRNPMISEGTRFAVRETYDLPLVDALIHLANRRGTDTHTRETTLEVLASLALRLPEWKGEWWAYHPALAPPPPKTESWAGTDRIFATLTRALEDPNVKLRLAAIEGLRGARATNSAPRLSARFERERDPEARLALLTALGDLKDTGFSERLARVLREESGDPKLIETAVRTAGQLGGGELRSELLKLAGQSGVSEPARIEAIMVLGQAKADDALRVLGPALTNGSAPVRLAAQRAVAQIGGPQALNWLRALLGDPALRREAVVALGTMHNREAVPDLLAAWNEPATREAALAALAEVSDARALEAHLAALAGPDAALREKCMQSLKPIREEVLPGIEARAESLPPEVLRRLRALYEDLPRAKNGPLFSAALKILDAADYERYAAAHPGDAVKGQRLFFDERGAACIKCHSVAGHGGAVGPDLTL
ncbi:MAG TPA: HEAT repeat domain-containing protein, partial [Methylomirabilota bacterium]|nr:HEAT repeat domain-containing protein [Methylomirabilota bacterium]